MKVAFTFEFTEPFTEPYDRLWRVDCKSFPGIPPHGFGNTKMDALTSLFATLNSNDWEKFLTEDNPTEDNPVVSIASSEAPSNTMAEKIAQDFNFNAEADKKLHSVLAVLTAAILAGKGEKLAGEECEHCLTVGVNKNLAVCVLCHTKLEGPCLYGINIKGT